MLAYLRKKYRRIHLSSIHLPSPFCVRIDLSSKVTPVRLYLSGEPQFSLSQLKPAFVRARFSSSYSRTLSRASSRTLSRSTQVHCQEHTQEHLISIPTPVVTVTSNLQRASNSQVTEDLHTWLFHVLSVGRLPH